MHAAHTRNCDPAGHRAERHRPVPFARSFKYRLAAPCRAAAAAAGTGVGQLTPRQRRVEAKRKLKEAKRAQQQQQQQQEVASSPPPQGGKGRHSPTNSRAQQQQQAAGLPPNLEQLLHDLVHSAMDSLSFTLQQLQAAQPAAAAAASQLWVARTDMTQQQLADLAWCLAHFNVELQSRRFGGDMCNTHQLVAPSVPPQASLPAAAAAADPEPPAAAGQSGGAQQQVQQLCSACHAAMGTPFRVYPALFPSLQLEALMEEVELHQDTIYLEGGTRQVPEARLTGWQSDVGATFCYSGKQMQPQGRLTPQVAQVRDSLAALTGQHYDSVLVNYYPDGKCGMRFHVDPLYGVWTPNTAVVSIGDTRTFVFREIEDHSSRWVYQVANGDAVAMFGNCQEVLQHAIKVEREAEAAGPRLSLVFKQNIEAVQQRTQQQGQQ